MFVSIVMVVAYHKVNQYGQDVAALGRVDPTLALWGPFVLFAALIVWMYWRVAYVPGGQAIGGLETRLCQDVDRLCASCSRASAAEPRVAATVKRAPPLQLDFFPRAR